jgi:hypothetical protein
VVNVVRIRGVRRGGDGCHGRAGAGVAKEMWRTAILLSKTIVYLCILPWPTGIFRNAKTIALFMTALGRGVIFICFSPSIRLACLFIAHAGRVIVVFFSTKLEEMKTSLAD